MAAEVHGTHIRIPQGDTCPVRVTIDEKKLVDGDIGVFTVARRDGAAILRKLIEPDLENNAYHMSFEYDDTVKLRPGDYDWSFRVVNGAQFDGNGRMLGTEDQDTPVTVGRFTVLGIAGGAR